MWIRRDCVWENLSLRGLFFSGENLAVDEEVHLRLFAAHRLEADGTVRHCDGRGAGTEFRGLSEERSRLIHEFIDEFIPGEMLVR